MFRTSLFLAAASCVRLCGGDFGADIFYTQSGFGGVPHTVGKVHVQYTASTNSVSLAGNTVLISSATDANFAGADGMTMDPTSTNLMVGGGGQAGFPGVIYQVTQAGAEGNPFVVSMTPPTPAYTPSVIPANGSKSGFPPGTLMANEKEFGYGRISIFPLSGGLGSGVSYPVTGDDIYVDSVAFTTDGTAYYGSGTNSSNAGNFGTITFDGIQFTTHRLFGQPVGADARGGVVFAGTHQVIFDPLTGDILTAGGSTVGQYDPSTNLFHVLSVLGAVNNFQFSHAATDGQGHIFITVCCGLPGDTQNGEGDLVVVDYSGAASHLIDAPSGVHYNHVFLGTNLAGIVIASSAPPPPGPPVITQQPQNTSAIVGESATFAVTATGGGLTYQWQSKPPGAPAFATIAGATSSSYATPVAAATDDGTQFNCVITNPQGPVTSGFATLTVLPASTNYVTSSSLGTLRNNYTGWVGMSISVGNLPLAITSLGRWFVAGVGNPHTVKIVSAATGNDVPGASVNVSIPGGFPGGFAYKNLAAAVTLNANTTYYVLSQEIAGGDKWYDNNTTSQTTSAATLLAAEYGLPYAASSSAGHQYGPLDFKYAVAVVVTVTPSPVTLSNSGTQQFSATVTGTLNSAVTWGINPLSAGGITAGGLYTAPSSIASNQSVTVTATSVADVTKSGTATVNLIPPPPPTITQQPQSLTVATNQTAMFTVVASGGGLTYQWESKPSGGVFSPISGAVQSSYTTPPVSASDSGTQFHCIVTNAQGPVTSNAAVLTVSSGTAFVTSTVLGTARNNFSGWVGMTVTVGSTGVSVSALGRMVVTGNSGTHAMKIVDAASGADVIGSLTNVVTSGAPFGSFVYASLNSPVGLAANTTYYVLSQETSGSDQWDDLNTTVQTTAIASVNGPVYSSGASYVKTGTPAHSYVPVDFRYTVPIVVKVSPSPVTLSNAGTQQFTATVTGTGNTTVAWTISPVGAGSITSPGGLYTAPSSILSNQPVTVTATSAADASKFGTATVNLTPPSPPSITQQPQSTTVATGQAATFSVVASGSGLSYQWESQPSGAASFSPIGGATSSSYTTPLAVITDSGTQFHCIVSNPQGPVTSQAAVLTVSSGTSFVTSFVLGTVRNNFSGWVGTTIRVGNVGASVSALGRMVVQGNSASHAMKIVDAASGNDVSGSLTNVITVGAPAGSFVYAALNSPVGLSANTTYYILSQETLGGDQWYDQNTTLQSTLVASVGLPVYSGASGYLTTGVTGHSYVPVDFRYTPAVPNVSFTNVVTPGTLRNNFSGWVGASITTGTTQLKLTHLGHFVASGNTGTHTVKIVDASNSLDVAGGSVSINLGGGQQGTFVYAALVGQVTLNANSTYYILTQETSGGDQWYDVNTTAQTAAVAALNGGAYSSNGSSYTAASSPGHLYGPVDFKYSLQ